MGDIYGLVPLLPGKHLDFSGAHPPNELWDHSFSSAEGDSVVDVAQVWLEAGGDVDSAQTSMEAHDFKGTASKLLLELLLPGLTFVKFLAGVEGAAVDGSNKSVCDGVDGFIDVGVCVEEHLGCSRRYWGKFLFGLVCGGGEVE